MAQVSMRVREKERRSGWRAVLLVSLAVSACGGRTDENPSVCDSIAGCGGDLEGAWKVTQMCVGIYDGSAAVTSFPECEAVMRHALDSAVVVAQNATISFAAGNYAETGTKSVDTTFAYTDACLAAQGFGRASSNTCNAVGASLLSQPESPGSVACAPDSNSCVCHVTGDVPFGDGGFYQVVGTQIFFDSDFEGGPFCVHGDRALVSALSNGTKTRLALSRQP